MFQILSRDALMMRSALHAQMHRARGQQFGDRHKWNVTRTLDGFEIDQFDTAGTRYLVVQDGDAHAASLRLRAARDGSMVEQAFAGLWDRHGHALADKVEVTRLCAAPDLDASRRKLAVARLLLGLCRHCRATGEPEIFGLVFPSVARTLDRAGWACDVIGTQDHDGKTLILARWTATAIVDWTLQESIARLEDRVNDRYDVPIILRAVA